MPPSARDGEDGESPRPAKRSRVLVACARCKHRRQKCDNATPACSNCARSKATCSYPPNFPSSSYVNQLEERIGMLEERLRQQSSDHTSGNLQGHQSVMGTPSSMPSQQSPVAASSGHLAPGIGLLSSIAASEPHYFGFSSGLTLAHFVEAAIAPDDGASDINLPSLADRPFSKRVPTAQTPLAAIPSYSAGSKYIRAYLSNVHSLYPFIDEAELWRLNRQVTEGGQSSSHSHTDLARLHLIYAIGSRCMQLLKPRRLEEHLPESHLLSAMQHIPNALKLSSTHAVEITLLLAIHSMRSPSGASVWHLCGFAMRLCLELGLHRPKPSHITDARLEQQRRKLFWSVYIFERKSALVLGRPFTVSDKDIEVSLPDDSNDGEMTLHRLHIRLYAIHSKIRSALHYLKSGASAEKVGVKVAACLQRLDGWKGDVQTEVISQNGQATSARTPGPGPQSDSSDSGDEIPPPHLGRPPTADRIELLLEYSKARRSLLQPLLTEPGLYVPTLSDYIACADAAGSICQLYRQLHRQAALPFTLRDLHAVVIAGFTSIYCIMARPVLYNAHRARDIGACSTVLYVIAEQWKSARRYRDAFEAVADKLVELVANAQKEASSNTAADGDNVGALARDNTRLQSSMGQASQHDTSGLVGDLATSTLEPGPFASSDGDMNGLLSSIFEDSFANYDMDYGDDGLRELLAHEGLDWFSNV